MNARLAPQPTVYAEFVRFAEEHGQSLQGHHHINYRVPLTPQMASVLWQPVNMPVLVRIPRPDILRVVFKTWANEARVLDAIRDTVDHAPVCLAHDWMSSAVHSYVQGVPLSKTCRDIAKIDRSLIEVMAEGLARLTGVDRDAVPPLPPGWPRPPESQEFLRTVVELTERDVREPNWQRFHRIFERLGVRPGALMRLAGRVPRMTRRPFSLLHGDLHRDNVIVTRDGDPPLVFVDWELASFGDPLHDLAVHLVRTGHTPAQRDAAINAWTKEVQRHSPEAANGLDDDLGHYIAFERTLSVFPDVMRTLDALERRPPHEQRLRAATVRVHNALTAAAELLDIDPVPPLPEIWWLLKRWTEFIHGAPIDSVRRVPVQWTPDRAHPCRPEFRDPCVKNALADECRAPESRLLRGTAHVNAVVVARVAGADVPVVVRRRRTGAERQNDSRRLDESTVLRALEEEDVPVSAPRVLASGEGGRRPGAFAVQTYLGPSDGSAPEHPVDGLRPHEAKSVVDQLCALTRVDYLALRPRAPRDDYYRQLTDELVDDVRYLPDDVRALAEGIGLPGHRQLRAILSRYTVEPRTPTLLHGDLHPWNLVRTLDDRFNIALIGWDRARVGDPLYDLVRHTCLARTDDRRKHFMKRHWERSLPRHYTRGWLSDWSKYERLEIVRAAYEDLGHLVSGRHLDVPRVRTAVDSYAWTLQAALAELNLEPRRDNPYLLRALPH
ncbi:aminoglycoside phosphotransferase family protein [Streptomyces sp. uw30]|uniref:aminoglycoside phosphotransferase family protein n=1 Tax=Streptomyces sp. uw30 TaxID=1828179 RepID=UPI0011CE1FC4|nr:aminoglycoside phosphotransferase family protein [Streptomyces sp. uw30]TXS41186.1 aminoglycoside phosphotransferase family protein [Streptomyces sp. uw30]